MDDVEVEKINRKEAECLQRSGNANAVAKMFVMPVIGFMALGVTWNYMSSAMEACTTIALGLAVVGVAITIGVRRDWG